MKSRLVKVAAITAVAALALSGCSSSGGDGSGSSSTLSMYCALPDEECNDFIADFESDTGIKVQSVRLSAGEILSRVEAEKGHPNAAIWFGGSTDNFINATSKDLLEEYEADAIDEIPEEYRDDTGHWTPFYVGAIGLATNEEWLEESGNAAPDSWEDLLDPKYKGNVMMAHPASSGTAYTTLAAFVQLWGEDKAFDYLKKLNGNIRHYTNSGSAPASQAGIGEAHVGISFSHDILAAKAEGYPITLSFPSEGVGSEVGATALIKGAPESEREAAETFIDWVVSKKGQNTFARNGWFHLPLRADADVPDGAKPLSEIKLIDYDAQWAAEHRDELLDRFSKEVAGQSEAKD